MSWIGAPAPHTVFRGSCHDRVGWGGLARCRVAHDRAAQDEHYFGTLTPAIRNLIALPPGNARPRWEPA